MATELTWAWEPGEQPAFTPRHATVPRLALERLHRARDHVVLGWFHRYPARFAAEVVTDMLVRVVTEARRPVARVLDPFCGTGSVVAAGRQLGLAAIGLELSTLGVTVGRLRLDPPADPWTAAAACERLAAIPPAVESRVEPELADWLGTANARHLTAIKPALDEIEDERTRRFITVAVSQSLRPSSRWLPGSVKATADPRRDPIPLAHSLVRWARQLARDCETERNALTGVPSEAAIVHGNARKLPLADGGVDAIVTSPPYFITYDYFEIQRLSYLAFGWPMPRRDQIGAKYGHHPLPASVALPEAFRSWYEHEFRAERTFLGRALRAYTQDLRTHLAEAARVVAPGGLVAYSVANSVRAGRVFDLVSGFAELLGEAGFADVHALPRVQAGRRILPPGRDVRSGRFSSDAGRAGVREYIVFGQR
ncbi:hypothetical protein [Acrocarpospora catenulata]|uniref:hypothetical protein n=1 Tax=Acrocarpospora catenulata TaxID=2836182 RepID=UPI001BDA2134|nr:hypothetical protein [Acrocarpospora catenulata]